MAKWRNDDLRAVGFNRIYSDDSHFQEVAVIFLEPSMPNQLKPAAQA